MNCPYCNHVNIAGADTCENCAQDLTDLDRFTSGTGMAANLMQTSLEELRPKPPVIISPDSTVSEAIRQLREHKIGCVLVGDDAGVVGIFSERDALLRVVSSYEEAAELPIRKFMTPDPVHLDIHAPIAFSLNRMAVGDFRHILVTNEGKLVGIISMRDILRFMSEIYPDLISSEL